MKVQQEQGKSGKDPDSRLAPFRSRPKATAPIEETTYWHHDQSGRLGPKPFQASAEHLFIQHKEYETLTERAPPHQNE